MLKVLFVLVNLILGGSAQCLTQTNVMTSTNLFSYKGNVYDATGYNHPGGQRYITNLIGKDLETFVNANNYGFHLNKNKFFTDLSVLLVGPLCVVTAPPIVQTTLPVVQTTLPIVQTTLPIVQTTLPIVQTTLPCTTTTAITSTTEMSDDDSSESDTTTTDPGLNSKNISSSSNLVKTSICLCLINISILFFI